MVLAGRLEATPLLEKASAFNRPLKPTAIISGPMLFPGCRPQV
jgi:hypothetical protein